ncbi:hypothetical protein RSOLAG1IB_12183 [Rhizoctonia solani AG-1 IB]|uniref:DUF6589 domain-containing protein n=1 Tax=Thanatephorus cucumeris (strain AG1-IB / isolate 7/3/14) TaxID=1108050 RepID=M5CC89_THACB|nr:hypothetical protein BN14_11719 [Rhizoctonia solani AG-1 IB]CEL58713.1 hypothetical protein RSOLAG1IB_12183 [Rhizoctonia solani AG-1 IB]
MSGKKRNSRGSVSPKKRQKQQAETPPEPSPDTSASSLAPDTQNTQWESSRNRLIELVGSIHASGFTMDTFLYDLCYGNPLARQHGSLQKARRDLRKSNLLPQILDNLHTTPRAESGGQQAAGAVEPLETWATQTTQRIYREELVKFSKAMHCDISQLVNEETLRELTFDSILDAVKECCPRLMDMLLIVAQPKRKEEGRRAEKDSIFSVVQIISSLSYEISQRNNRTQMFTAIYLKAKNAPKSVYTMLQHAGLSLSYSWAEEMLKTISRQAVEKMVKVYEEGACVFIYDNYRIPHGIKHQRIGHLSVTDNATTATLIPLPPEATTLLNNPSKFTGHRKDIKEQYINRTMRFLEPGDFHQPDVDILINDRLEYNIIAALFRIPEIKNLQLEVLSDPLLQPPPPVDMLPSGKEHISKQYMFGTMDHDESSLTGASRVQLDMLGQLNQTSQQKRKDLGTSRMQYIVGDNLTNIRGLGLQQLKQSGLNSFDRNDWIIWVPGWFHLLMNFGRAIYFEHYGTNTGLLLARDAATLNWSGLTKPTRNKGPDFHTLDEALHIILEARYRGLWLWVTGATSPSELVTWAKSATVAQIKLCARKIWTERASQRALSSLDQQKTQTTESVGRRKKTITHNEDQVLEGSIRLQHDLMLFEECRRAIRYGDVGRMDHLLPQILMCFTGSKRWNYVREILNILQWEWHEAPEGFVEATRRYAWLVNFNGEPNGFYADDLRQELNNLNLRVRCFHSLNA